VATDPVLEAWLKGPEHLAPQVEQLFREVTSRFAPPGTAGCLLFTQHLHAIGPAGYGSEPDSRVLAIKAGEAFLERIEHERASIFTWLGFIAVFSPGSKEELEVHRNILREISAIKLSCEVLFQYLAKESDRGEDPIRSLARVAQELWGETNNGRAPRSVKAEGVLCRLLEGQSLCSDIPAPNERVSLTF
jgi:hypothetical protein